MRNTTDRDAVAWDIETTGFLATDDITVSGFRFPTDEYVVIVNTGSDEVDADIIQPALQGQVEGDVTVYTHQTDAQLLERIRQVIFNKFEREYNALVAYNAECWNGGFDLPFVRTACALEDVEWVFEGLMYGELFEVVKKRFNTTCEEKEMNDLVGAHEVLVQSRDSYIDIDPFDDSKEAVSSYNKGEYIDVALHNLADLKKTYELSELAEQYASPKDWREKKL